MAVTLYGIPNCDTVKKARTWLEQENIDYRFHDFRKDGLESSQVEKWIDELGWEVLVNKRSTSWKALDEGQRKTMDAKTALSAILDSPTLIKRPLLDNGQSRNVGFKAQDYEALFKG